MSVPAKPKIYHIIHVDRLPSVVTEDCLWCDAKVGQLTQSGSTIGMTAIKHRRMHELSLTSYPNLHVGDCVPFYFCPRSIMLYLIHRANHSELAYRGGQEPILHLEADLHASVDWAKQSRRRWAFTTSNAGAKYFTDYCNLEQLDKIDWEAVQASEWQSLKEGKQAEFLMERSYPWSLIERIGVNSEAVRRQVISALSSSRHLPRVDIQKEWYY